MFSFPGSLISSREDTPPNLSNTTFGYISSIKDGDEIKKVELLIELGV